MEKRKVTSWLKRGGTKAVGRRWSGWISFRFRTISSPRIWQAPPSSRFNTLYTWWGMGWSCKFQSLSGPVTARPSSQEPDKCVWGITMHFRITRMVGEWQLKTLKMNPFYLTYLCSSYQSIDKIPNAKIKYNYNKIKLLKKTCFILTWLPVYALFSALIRETIRVKPLVRN